MAKKQKLKSNEQLNPADVAYQNGRTQVWSHPIFSHLEHLIIRLRQKDYGMARDGLVVAEKCGVIHCNAFIRAEPGEWARSIAHSYLHYGMGHFKEKPHPKVWNAACDYVAEKFLTDLKFGTSLTGKPLPPGVSDEEKMYERILGLPETERNEYFNLGTAGAGVSDMVFLDEYIQYSWRSKLIADAEKAFAAGLTDAVRNAVDVASGTRISIFESGEASNDNKNTLAKRIRNWFISSYPLLGAIAAGFKIIEDPLICHRMQISVAAISPSLCEIYLNPAAGLKEKELRFVMAHEFLHAALRHDARQEWRDAYLWNVACDFVINSWLTEMGVGERPADVLYDEQFKNESAESVYDRIVTDMRIYRKLETLRGYGLGDIIEGDLNGKADSGLDAFYRRALSQGLEYHREQGRGYLPEGLIEEIRALSHPPIPWDVELAKWFDEFFSPLEKTRSYARPSRRQASSPDIPRPNWSIPKHLMDGRTYGVVLDTSGSMDRGLLATALGAIASFSVSRDVPAVRVVFCDADAYDQGYMEPEEIAGRVKVRGRGGTVLQPGIDLLLKTEDFPENAPILIIIDGYCENRLLFEGREHAFLIPAGSNLPFVPKGKVFRFK